MTDSKAPSIFQSLPPQKCANSAAFRVVLTDLNHFDTFDYREFHLPMHTEFPIGRASKNTTKKDLMPSPNNAFIDSPVISREHATLSVNASTGSPRVYITDSGSMHGTLLNGHRLVPKKAEPLSTGDTLQFGIDVNRNDGMLSPGLFPTNPESHPHLEYFVARKYSFESHLSPSFSQGFTVPDAESEEEEVEVDIMDDCGSQNNPMMILDDSDAEPEHSDHEEQKVISGENLDAPTAEPIPAAVEVPLYQPILMVEETDTDNDDDEDSEIDYPSEPDYGHSQLDFIGYADMGSESPASSDDSEPEVSDSEEEEEEEEEFDMMPPTPIAVQEAQPPASLPIPPTTQALDASSATVEAAASTQAPELPPFDMFPPQIESHPFADSCMPPPLPPRPMYLSAPWDMPPPPRFAPQSEDVMYWYAEQGPYTIPAEQRPPTPPPTSNLDVIKVTSPQPSRRTRVSIDEIVEEQPLAPVSSNNLKRKADVLVEEEHTAILGQSAIPEGASSVAPVVVTAEMSAVISQRPKKQPRSIMKRALSKATYPLLGAAGAVVSFTLLSTLPDSFFGP